MPLLPRMIWNPLKMNYMYITAFAITFPISQLFQTHFSSSSKILNFNLNIIQFMLLSHHKLNQFIFHNLIDIHVALTQIYNLHTVQTAIPPNTH